MLDDNNLAIICGRGSLPLQLTQSWLAESQNHKIYYIFIDDGGSREYENDLIKYSNIYTRLGWAKLGAAIKFLKKHKIKNVNFAGHVQKPSINKLIPDLKGFKTLLKLRRLKSQGDNSILSLMVNFYEEEGFTLLSSQDIEPTLLASIDFYKNKQNISQRDLYSINLGFKTLELTSKCDIGQVCVVSNNVVISIEGIEGTKRLIERSVQYNQKYNNDLFLVKTSKVGQNMQCDVATIGPETIDDLIKNNYKGLAIEANRVIILEQEKVLQKLEKSNLILYIK